MHADAADGQAGFDVFACFCEDDVAGRREEDGAMEGRANKASYDSLGWPELGLQSF